MKKELIILYTLVLFVGSALAYSVGTNHSVYDTGFNEGYAKGYDAAVANYPVYPKMTINGWQYASGKGTVSIGGLTFSGEQNVLDAIKRMPEILKVSDNASGFSIGFVP